jgi:hypothetical protein
VIFAFTIAALGFFDDVSKNNISMFYIQDYQVHQKYIFK